VHLRSIRIAIANIDPARKVRQVFFTVKHLRHPVALARLSALNNADLIRWQASSLEAGRNIT
jgi:hypothetical protein